MSTARFVSEDILILTKTYPAPSKKYRETTCVAGVSDNGALRRIFPVPFRLLEGESRFKRWEWVRVKTSPKTSDPRPESRKIEIDAIIRLRESVGTADGWAKRLALISPHVISDPDALEARRGQTKETLGFVAPTKCVGLDITEVADPEWTDDELEKLTADGLFDTSEARSRTTLRKLPHDFHYRYQCQTPSGPKEFRHKVTDWEFGALYWNCMRRHGPKGWQAPFRQKVEHEFFETHRLLFLLGTMHLHPHRWLIVGVIYPPKPQPPPASQQLDLLLVP